jgi:hypothetical protein
MANFFDGQRIVLRIRILIRTKVNFAADNGVQFASRQEKKINKRLKGTLESPCGNLNHRLVHKTWLAGERVIRGVWRTAPNEHQKCSCVEEQNEYQNHSDLSGHKETPNPASFPFGIYCPVRFWSASRIKPIP